MDGSLTQDDDARARRKRVVADVAAELPPTAWPRRVLERGVIRYRAGAGGRLRAVGNARAVGRSRSLIYAIGDIHGRYDLLCDLLRRIARDQASDARTPLLVFCGDYIDRGPDSDLVIETLLWLQQAGPWPLVLLKGNHEQVLLEFTDDPIRARGWLQVGGDAVFSAYGLEPPDAGDEFGLIEARDALMDAMPASHLRLLQQLDALAVVGDYAFAHAGVAPGTALHSQREADLLWIREEFLNARRPCDHVVVHGHSWTSALPAMLEHRIGVDTGAFRTGVLTAVRLDGDERKVLQARDARALADVQPEQTLVRRPPDFTGAQVRLNLGFQSSEYAPLRLDRRY